MLSTNKQLRMWPGMLVHPGIAAWPEAGSESCHLSGHWDPREVGINVGLDTILRGADVQEVSFYIR